MRSGSMVMRFWRVAVLAAVLGLAPQLQAQTFDPVLRTTLTVTPPATPGNAAGSASAPYFGTFHTAEIVGALTGNTGGVLNIYIQTSFDGGTTWCDYAAFAQVAAAAPLGRFRFAVSKTQPTAGTIAACTDGTLTAGTILGGDWGDRLRLKAVSGASSSASSLQTVFITFTP